MMTLNAVVFEKNGETFVWTFRDGEEERALEAICQQANCGDLNLDWNDANLIWQRMGEAPQAITFDEMIDNLSFAQRR